MRLTTLNLTYIFFKWWRGWQISFKYVRTLKRQIVGQERKKWVFHCKIYNSYRCDLVPLKVSLIKKNCPYSYKDNKMTVPFKHNVIPLLGKSITVIWGVNPPFYGKSQIIEWFVKWCSRSFAIQQVSYFWLLRRITLE